MMFRKRPTKKKEGKKKELTKIMKKSVFNPGVVFC